MSATQLVWLAVALVCAVPRDVAANVTSIPEDADYLWLEESDAAPLRRWVVEQNSRTVDSLTASPLFRELRSELLSVLRDPGRIPYVRKLGAHYYNFWRDEQNPRGILRRTDWESYVNSAPRWETVLDLDALATAEQASWVWRGVDCLQPRQERCLMHLSNGGGDAVVIREFDLPNRRFISDGFQLPEGKSRVAWRDLDHLYVGANFGAGSLTAAGYPRSVRLWHRGSPLEDSPIVFAGLANDVSVFAFVSATGDRRREFITRTITGNEGQTLIRRDDRWERIELPAGVEATTFDDQLLVWLRKDWRTGRRLHGAGSLLAIDLEGFLAGSREFEVLFRPAARSSLVGFSGTKDRLLLTVFHNLGSRLYSLQRHGTRWKQRLLLNEPSSVVVVRPVDEFGSNDYFLSTSGFLQPTALFLGGEAANGRTTRRLLWQLPAQFRTDNLVVQTRTVRSKDGTQIPYFEVAAKQLALGPRPTLLTGYGGFAALRTPNYDALVGKAWLERGGVYVVASIRGGGEFGPGWHEAAVGRRRQNAFDDFLAVARDLLDRKISSPKQLAVVGNSNGGLTVAAAVMQKPAWFAAAVCHAPLLDMSRYHKLSAGASWLAEYGNPERADHWQYLSKYSPFQNVVADRTYPPMLFTTSSRDDRVHPAHARKMVARMLDLGHEAWLYESPDGGHLGSIDAAGQAYLSAMTYAFLWERLQ